MRMLGLAMPFGMLLLGMASAACSQHDRDYASRSIIRWSITNSITGAPISSGCGNLSDRLSNIINFRGPAADEVWETQTWEEVNKTADQIPGQTDASYWCADQDGVDTVRSPRILVGEECVATQDADPPAKIVAVELVNPVAATGGTGRRLKLSVIRPGLLILAMAQPCWNAADMSTTCDPYCPPPWTELTILP
jgi:hypothetical protein